MSTDTQDELQMLRETARRYLEQAADPTVLKAAFENPSAAHTKVWPELAEMGWLGLAAELDEGEFLMLAVILEEAGRVCLPGPYFTSAVLSTMLVTTFGTDEQKQALLSKASEGALVLSTAIAEESTEFDQDSIRTTATRSGADYLLSGTKRMVPFASLAGALLCVAKLADVSGSDRANFGIFVVPCDAGYSQTVLNEISGPVCSDVVLHDVRLPASALLGGRAVAWTEIEPLLLKASVAKSAEMLGGATHAMEVAINYAKERRQFGKPIGSFQAIQHHCTNMLVLVETARRMLNETVALVEEGAPFEARAAATKVWCNHAYREVVRLAHQVLGGLGYIDEHVMPWHFRHARSSETILGDTDTLLEFVAADLFDRFQATSENDLILATAGA